MAKSNNDRFIIRIDWTCATVTCSNITNRLLFDQICDIGAKNLVLLQFSTIQCGSDRNQRFSQNWLWIFWSKPIFWTTFTLVEIPLKRITICYFRSRGNVKSSSQKKNSNEDRTASHCWKSQETWKQGESRSSSTRGPAQLQNRTSQEIKRKFENRNVTLFIMSSKYMKRKR